MHIQKIKEEKLTCETYLDLVDELRNDEECRFPVGRSCYFATASHPRASFNLPNQREVNQSAKQTRFVEYR